MRSFRQGFVWGFLLIGAIAWLLRERLLQGRRAVPVPMGRPEEPPTEETGPADDLTAIRGIGPAFAQRLLRAGIRRYAQLARMTPEEVAVRCGVAAWRVRRDDWVGQAARRSS